MWKLSLCFSVFFLSPLNEKYFRKKKSSFWGKCNSWLLAGLRWLCSAMRVTVLLSLLSPRDASQSITWAGRENQASDLSAPLTYRHLILISQVEVKPLLWEQTARHTNTQSLPILNRACAQEVWGLRFSSQNCKTPNLTAAQPGTSTQAFLCVLPLNGFLTNPWTRLAALWPPSGISSPFTSRGPDFIINGCSSHHTSCCGIVDFSQYFFLPRSWHLSYISYHSSPKVPCVYII